MARDYYAVLAVDPNATPDEIRGRFKQLARDKHPDRYDGAAKARAEEEFQAITEAFNVLNSPQRRRQYDQERNRPQAATGADPRELARVYVQRGTKAYREGNYYEAAEAFDRATQEDPSNAQAWSFLAQACCHQRRWLSRGAKAIAKACELEPMNPAYLKLAGRIFVQADMPLRGEKYYRQALQWGGQDREVLQALEGLGKKGT